MSDKLQGLAVADFSLEENKLVSSFTTKVTNAYNTANAAYARANSGILATGANVTGDLVFTTGKLGLGVTPNTLLHVQGTTTIQEVIEKVNVSATSLTANLNFDILNQPILFLTTNATANGTVNLRGNSTIAVDTLLRTGQSITVSLLVTNGALPYRANVVQVDGITQNARWAGGSEPINGNAFAIDLYSYTIIKTGTGTFTVLASQQRYG